MAITRLADLAGKGGRAAEARVARALQLLVAQPDQESEFRATARLILDHWNDIAGLAAEARFGVLSTRGMVTEDGGTIPALLVEVAQSGLLPHLAGAKARRYLAALVVELAIREPALTSERAFGDLARVIRLELQDLRRNDAARAPIPDPTGLLGLVDWIDRQPQRSKRFPDYFWDSWRRVLRDAALRVVYAAADELSTVADDDADASEPITFALQLPPSVGTDEPSPIGLIPPEDEPDPVRPRSPGLQRAITEALLSTYTPLELLSEASTTVLSDEEARSNVAALMLEFDAALAAEDLKRAESAIGYALTLATGSSASQVPLMRWAKLGGVPSRPAGISLDARWLVRPELVPEGAVDSSAQEPPLRSVWVPLPDGLRRRLLQLATKPQVGALVLCCLNGSSLLPSATIGTESTALRRTFFSRVARLEPLGITGAQWASGDDFGLDTAPLHYDRFPADALAQLIESITFPWFGERAGAARPERPTHILGSRVMAGPELLRKYFDNLRTELPESTGSPPIIERLRRRTRNLVHGFVAATGHRPHDVLSAVTLAHIDVVDGIAIVRDKQVAPDWPHRPVAITADIAAEFRELVQDLKLAAALAPNTPLARAAKAATNGSGPIFLHVQSAELVGPYSLADYLSDVPTDLRQHPNFARHLLNQGLIGRVPEALRVGQLGWHGTREGAWAETSLWSVKSAAAQLRAAVERHMTTIGWKPLPKYFVSPRDLPVCTVSWCDQELERRRHFAKATARLRQAHAKRLYCAARDLLPALQTAIGTLWPGLTIDDRFSLKSTADGTKKTIQVSAAELRRLEVLVAPGDARSQARAALRNVLESAFRRARKDGLVVGAAPRRIHWRVTTRRRPIDFVECAPAALRTCRSLEAWLGSPDTQLSLAARTAVGLLLFGPYGDTSAVLAAMHPTTSLARVKAYPDVVLADAHASFREGVSLHRTLAFHELAALALERWHRAGEASNLDLSVISRELGKAMPTHIFPASMHPRLEEIAALVRARNSLTMDGMARMVGTGVCRVNSVAVDRLAAVYDDHPVTRTAEARDDETAPFQHDARTDEPPDSPQPAATVRTVMALLARVQTRRRPVKVTDADARLQLRSGLSALLRRGQGETRVVDLIARFALTLLDEGGDHKEVLELITIQGYVAPIAYSLNKRLAEHPLEQDAAEWQEAFLRIVGSATPAMRHRKAVALSRFHARLSRHVPLPAIDVSELGMLSGAPVVIDAAALLSAAERRAVSAQLATDVTLLTSEGAAPREIHAARAREVYFSTMSASSLRPSEAWGLTLGNVTLGASDARISLSRHRWQRLKTYRSRRRIRLASDEATTAETQLGRWVSEVRQRVGRAARVSLPIFGRLDDPETPLDFGSFAARVGPLLRWATDDPSAVPYALRKTGIHLEARFLHRVSPQTLWTVRDFLKRAAHGSLIITIPCYLHDPLVIFDRWFRESLDSLDSASLSGASGRSISRISRAKGMGSIHGGRLAAIRNRLALLLDGVPYVAPTPGTVHPAPVVRQTTWFLASVEELDLVLRDLASGSELREIATRRSWPEAAHAILERLLEHMAGDFDVGFTNARQEVKVVVTPPRRLVKVLATSKENPAPVWHGLPPDILAQMGGSWLQNAAFPGLPDGIAALGSDWMRWHESVGTNFSQGWERQKFGPLDCREIPSPAGSSLSAWPLFRWEVVLHWMAAGMSSGKQSTNRADTRLSDLFEVTNS